MINEIWHKFFLDLPSDHMETMAQVYSRTLKVAAVDVTSSPRFGSLVNQRELLYLFSYVSSEELFCRNLN